MSSRISPEVLALGKWLAAGTASDTPVSTHTGRYAALLEAARAARTEFLGGAAAAAPQFETLLLLAAATEQDGLTPPPMTTPRGFQVVLAFDEGIASGQSSLAVFVQAPADLVASVAGQTVYLWSGNQRFSLGEFDADGRALGTLPAGVEISVADFRLGKIKLEEPPPPATDG